MRGIGNVTRAQHSKLFFRTGPGEYGEGDQFLGLDVPQVRSLAREYASLPLPHVRALLQSRWHEARLLALLILVCSFESGNPAQQKRVAELYLSNLARVNNWDLVDSSAPFILGPYLARGKRGLLDTLARSPVLWERRIAMLATFHYIRQGEFSDAKRIARRLLRDGHDLIHKAAGWMLREIGKRDEAELRAFLERHAAAMPRTMLRYSLERLDTASRLRYMKMKSEKEEAAVAGRLGSVRARTYRLPKS
jgi:3-methyladenine DNA glycosylase AlkD